MTRLVLPDMDIRNNGDGWNGYGFPPGIRQIQTTFKQSGLFLRFAAKVSSFPWQQLSEATKSLNCLNNFNVKWNSQEV